MKGYSKQIRNQNFFVGLTGVYKGLSRIRYFNGAQFPVSQK